MEGGCRMGRLAGGCRCLASDGAEKRIRKKREEPEGKDGFCERLDGELGHGRFCLHFCASCDINGATMRHQGAEMQHGSQSSFFLPFRATVRGAGLFGNNITAASMTQPGTSTCVFKPDGASG